MLSLTFCQWSVAESFCEKNLIVFTEKLRQYCYSHLALKKKNQILCFPQRQLQIDLLMIFFCIKMLHLSDLHLVWLLFLCWQCEDWADDQCLNIRALTYDAVLSHGWLFPTSQSRYLFLLHFLYKKKPRFCLGVVNNWAFVLTWLDIFFLFQCAWSSEGTWTLPFPF